MQRECMGQALDGKTVECIREKVRNELGAILTFPSSTILADDMAQAMVIP